MQRRRNRSTSGKYASVLKKYGREGFGIPSKAPRVGSFPLYPKKRARFALAIVASSAYDHGEKRKIRTKVVRRALAAHPDLREQWENSRPMRRNSDLPSGRKAPTDAKHKMRVTKKGDRWIILLDGKDTGKWAATKTKATVIAQKMATKIRRSYR